MIKKILASAVGLSMLFAASPVWAVPLVTVTLETPGETRTLFLPPAADNSPVIELGNGVDPESGAVVEGYAFIHYKKADAHEQRTNASHTPSNTCYAYLAKGAKWKVTEPWVMNTANSEGLDVGTLFGIQTAALDEWEDATDGNVGNGVKAFNIFGSGALTTSTLVADTASPDGVNEVYFGDVSSQGAIAVTIVWGIFSGPTFQRRLVEWDQIYDQVDFNWSTTGDSTKMDFENIVQHEDGHSAGMAHPSDSCTLETMFRFSGNGEIIKRDLNTGDIAGVNALY